MLLESYLKNSFQIVVINGAESNKGPNTSGITQSTFLGPILFHVYINDIFELQLQSKLQLCADDMILIFGSQTSETLKQQMTSDLEQVSHWLIKNTKTKYLCNIYYLFLFR